MFRVKITTVTYNTKDLKHVYLMHPIKWNAVYFILFYTLFNIFCLLLLLKISTNLNDIEIDCILVLIFEISYNMYKLYQTKRLNLVAEFLAKSPFSGFNSFSFIV